ncbi:hypothetical protein J1N35_029573, partial [Gossypium stocksii]
KRKVVDPDGKVWLSDEVINSIVSIPPPHPFVGSDRIIWTLHIRCYEKDLGPPKNTTWKIQGLYR